MDFVNETKEFIFNEQKILKLKRKVKNQRKIVKYKKLYEKYKELYIKEKKQNEEYVSLLNDARDIFGNCWVSFLNDVEEAKQFDDYSRYFVNDVLKDGQVENKEVINLTNKDGVIDKVDEKEVDYEYYLNFDNTNLFDDCSFMQYFEHNHNSIDNDSSSV
ncbi:17469_t:CDS:1 [Racocetra fulgida]|uniref:17469_t:CDS:1 n=1 Tax=Racocetra fulgida TaxID=60492 RepID=A0A9N9H300_9GLOM|nr:17469_t:CDS:1 [Racocetra fulgida]